MAFFTASILLILIGLYAVLVKRNIMKIVIGLSLMDTGVNLLIVSLGFIRGRTAPIINVKDLLFNTSSKVVDPLPQALVLTAIVIGVAVTAVALSIVMLMYSKKGTLEIDEYKELKW
ncbi:MAG: NADH-quinone oxidoreductase subunit K [Candidatus Aminicenantes bacterium]|nr:NADH-quinone oxidoreductase subunit K [Candidatus Aminicenantes bacterium]